MPNKSKINVSEENHGQRLDRFLVSQFPDTTRSQIQRYIKAGEILVNDKNVTPHNFLKHNDKITIKPSVFKDMEEKAKPFTVEPNKKIKLKIVFEDDHIIIIDKPAGIIVHPTDRREQDTLANAIVAYYPQIKDVGEDPMRPGIVHRIDKEVSGLLLICKTQEAFEYFKKKFKGRTMFKQYTALVHNPIEESKGVIDMPIERHKAKGKMVARPKSQEAGRQAITEYEETQKFEHFSLLKVTIKTGRTHQIRTHMTALNHPIVGDKLYKQKKVKQNIDLDRIFLHATKLGFKHITGEKLEFESKLPNSLNKILKMLQ